MRKYIPPTRRPTKSQSKGQILLPCSKDLGPIILSVASRVGKSIRKKNRTGLVGGRKWR